MTEISKKVLDQMYNDFDAIQMPRTPYALKEMVIGSHYTPEQCRAQMVLEMNVAYSNLRTAKCNARLKEIEISKMKSKTEKQKLEKELKEIELESLNLARTGALREFTFLFGLRSKGKKHYTRDQLNNASPEEYRIRLETQAQHDILSSGKISVGNLEGLRQIKQIDKYANMLNMKQPALVESGMDPIEERYLEEGQLKATIIIPSEKPLVDGTPLTQDIMLPTNVEFKIRNIHSAPVAENYCAGIEMAIKEGCTHVLTCEDDQVLEEDSIIRLFDFALKNPDCCVGAYYLKKEPVKKGVHIHVVGAHRQFLEDDNQIHEVKTLAMGLTLYPVEILKKVGYPYCKTTTHLSQDSYLSQKIRDLGYKLLVDCSIKIGHKDRVTGKIFGEVKKPLPKAMQVPEELAGMLEYVKGKKMILEIGTALGGTIHQMMKVADPKAHFVSIDMPDGPYGGEFGQPDIKEMRKWLQEGQKLSVIRFDSKHESTIKEVKKILGKKKFDFALIDGDHTYEGVKGDYELYKGFINGPIAFHDIAHHNQLDVGVERFWNELKGKKTEIIKDRSQGRAGIGILDT